VPSELYARLFHVFPVFYIIRCVQRLQFDNCFNKPMIICGVFSARCNIYISRLCTSMPNFVKVGQSVAKILRFFDFSRWRPSAILDLFGAYFDHPQWVLGGLYHSAKFSYDRCSSFFIIWIFQYLARLAGKYLITPPKLSVWDNLIL